MNFNELEDKLNKNDKMNKFTFVECHTKIFESVKLIVQSRCDFYLDKDLVEIYRSSTNQYFILDGFVNLNLKQQTAIIKFLNQDSDDWFKNATLRSVKEDKQTDLNLQFNTLIERYNDKFAKYGYNVQISRKPGNFEILETKYGTKLGDFFASKVGFMSVITNSALDPQFLRIVADYIDARNAERGKVVDK